MRFLADESCDAAVIVALQEAGHAVKAVAEVACGADDVEVIEIARREQLTLLTEDKDFGQLHRASVPNSPGVILLRFPATARGGVPTSVVKALEVLGSRVERAFTVIQPGRIRITEEPGRAL